MTRSRTSPVRTYPITGPSRGWRRRAAFLAVAAVAPSAAACTGTDQTIVVDAFAASVDYPVGLSPSSLAVGDLNGDGKPDLAIAERANHSVSVLINAGDGTFAARPREFAVGNAPVSVAIGDLNGDTKLDLAVANLNDDTVSILLNSGDDAIFTPALTFRAGTRPSWVAMGDVNGDRMLDLAVVDFGSNLARVLLGSERGTSFLDPDGNTLGNVVDPFPDSVAVGELDGHGGPDLAIANASDGGSITVLLNAGAGSFVAGGQYLVGKSSPGGVAYSVVIADLDGDQKSDLVVVNFTDDTVSVLINVGNGQFAPAHDSQVSIPMGHPPANPISVAVGDLDGDGMPDLAVANNGNGTVSVLINDGRGAFELAANYAVGGSPQSAPISVQVSDVNGDGKRDIVVANQETGNVSVLLNTGGLYRE